MKKKPNIIFIICLIVLIAAVLTVVIYQINKKNNEQSYEDLAAEVTEEISSPAEPQPETSGPQIPIDFAALQEKNADAYAWICIPDTQVDYPVLQSASDVDYYLDHTFEGAQGLPGALYTQYNYNSNAFEDPVTVIYGHNMRDDSFFGGLADYLEEDFRNSHREILVYTPEHIYHYRVAFAVTYDDRLILGSYNCGEPAGVDAFLTSIQTERMLPSWIEEPFTVTGEDHLIVLSTCNGNSTQRFLVGAVLGEKE